jgi:hypothetical protein
MADVALITVHGMGETPREYAADLAKRLRARIGPSFDRQVDLRAVYYQQILQPNEQEVWRRITGNSRVRYDQLRKFLLFGFGDAAGLENRKEDSGSVYELAQIEIAKTLLDAYVASGPNTPVVLLSHSLGCQVLSSYIYDAQKARSGVPVAAGVWKDIDHWSRTLQGRALTESEKAFLACGTALGWITTGCNIPIFVAAQGDDDHPDRCATTQLQVAQPVRPGRRAGLAAAAVVGGLSVAGRRPCDQRRQWRHQLYRQELEPDVACILLARRRSDCAAGVDADPADALSGPCQARRSLKTARIWPTAVPRTFVSSGCR